MIIKNPFADWDVSITKKYPPVKKKVPQKPASRIVNRDYSKVFIIGFNKTGTTTMAKLLRQFGLKVPNEIVGEMLAEEWILQGRTDRLMRYCETADAFQDIPFSFPLLYKKLYERFPKAKFILTTRDSDDQWVDSLMGFHNKIYASNKEVGVTADDLASQNYVYKGWSLDVRKWIYDYPDIAVNDREAYKKVYNSHNTDVLAFFQDKQDQFLHMNVSKNQDFSRLCSFLNVETDLKEFPWANKTSTIEV
ncbi:MAG: sulfotransferase [Nonlabens sp.]